MLELGQQIHMDDEKYQDLERMYYVCKGLVEWDKFEYREAAKLIELYKHDEHIQILNSQVKRLVGTIDWYDRWTPED
jgi:hypothetical protein